MRQGKGKKGLELGNVYPYLVPGLINESWERITIPVGHDVYATLFEDQESKHGIVHSTVTPDALVEAGLTPEAAHAAALENLERFVWGGTERGVKVQSFGRPGDPVNFVLISGHPRASASLRLANLYARASEWLKCQELCACVPQRESLVVMPKRDRTYREMLVAKLVEIEAKARRPISFGLFELDESGVRAFFES